MTGALPPTLREAPGSSSAGARRNWALTNAVVEMDAEARHDNGTVTVVD
jgi:hypothetical protein